MARRLESMDRADQVTRACFVRARKRVTQVPQINEAFAQWLLTSIEESAAQGQAPESILQVSATFQAHGSCTIPTAPSLVSCVCQHSIL